MEIQSLKLLLTDADLAGLLAHNPPPGEKIDELKAHITPEGVIVSGRYPTPFFPVAFETTWRLSVCGPEVRAKLAEVRVLGLPGAALSGALMKMIADAVEGKPGVRVENDSVVAHVGEGLKAVGLGIVVNLVAVRLSVGAAVIEAGPAG